MPKLPRIVPSILLTSFVSLATAGNALALTVGIFSTLDQGSAQITAAVEGLGHTVVSQGYNLPLVDADVYVSFYDACTLIDPADIAAGHNLVQIGDFWWNEPFTTTDFVTGAAATAVTIEMDVTHPITAGVDQSWTSRGELYSDDQLPRVAWSTDASLTSLASAGGSIGESHVLTAHEIGLGRAVFIGWNVYSDPAATNDLMILDNSLHWAAVPEPGTGVLLMLGIVAMGVRRSAARGL